MSAIKNLLGFRACNFQHVSLASGRTVFSYCGADPSKAKKRLSSPSPCSASPEVQQQCIQLHSMGCTEEYHADPPLTSTKTADRPISKLSRNFDFKIRAGSNSVADRLNHVEDVAEYRYRYQSHSTRAARHRIDASRVVLDRCVYSFKTPDRIV
jgi:hypothetical protein